MKRDFKQTDTYQIRALYLKPCPRAYTLGWHIQSSL